MDRHGTAGHNSSAELRLSLLEKLAVWWPREEVPVKSFSLIADREFGGEDWLLKVAQLGFGFVVRIKSNRQLTLWLNEEVRHKATSLRVLHRYLSRLGRNHAEMVIAGAYIGSLVCLPNTGTRDPGPYFYLLTNLGTPA